MVYKYSQKVNYTHPFGKGETMVNSKMLNGIIKESGLKKELIAKTLGVSTTSLKSKVEGRTDFKSEEIYALKGLLNLSLSQINELFFMKRSE